MSTIPSSTLAARSRRRRWPRRLALLVLVFVGLPAAYYAYLHWSLDAEINRAVAETDALDARWRLQELEADRKSYRDEDNAALHIIKVRAMIGKRSLPSYQKYYEEVFKDLPANAQLNVQQFEMIRSAMEPYPEAVALARNFKDMPGGRFPLTLAPGFIATLLPNHQDGRDLASLLLDDAMLRVHSGDPETALESCAAALNIGRAYGDEPFIISLLIRMVCTQIAVQGVERTLAQSQAKAASLPDLQRRLAEERVELRQRFIDVIRGERAGHHEFFEALHQRKLRLGDVMVHTMRMNIAVPEHVAVNFLPELHTKHYPQHLRHMNALVEAARLPVEEHLDRFTALSREVDRNDPRKAELSQVLPLVPPDLTKACKAHLRAQAKLAAAEAGLACERFRLAKQRWPASLAELVQAGLLDAVPNDPCDGQPLRFVRRPDGLIIYSVGYDKRDDGGNLIPRDRPLEPGGDAGFRLWDPPQRRQAARPPAALAP